MYTLAPKHLYGRRDCLQAKVYTIWANGPLESGSIFLYVLCSPDSLFKGFNVRIRILSPFGGRGVNNHGIYITWLSA